MRPETQRAETFAGESHRATTETVTCQSCRAELLPGMRFCRMCGFRLGEGLAEYTETVRLNGMPLMSPPPAAQTTRTPAVATTSLNSPATRMRSRSSSRRRYCGGGWRMGWLSWVFIAILISGVTGGGRFLSSVIRSAPHFHVSVPLMSRSFLGVDDFDYVRGEGVMLDAVLPGTPAHSAGLRDGDLIQRFDGKTINSEEDMRDTLRRTPVGKTVEVVYTRDGTTRTTMLKTIAPDDYDQQAFLPANGTGYLGVDGLSRVPAAGADAYGVRLGRVLRNQPADIAGLKQGDIIVSFNGDPVRTTTGLGSYIDHAAPGSTSSVGILRDGQRVEVPVKMGKDD
jgi:membrane-associated protease RseP (regulator of RpoE activity)